MWNEKSQQSRTVIEASDFIHLTFLFDVNNIIMLGMGIKTIFIMILDENLLTYKKKLSDDPSLELGPRKVHPIDYQLRAWRNCLSVYFKLFCFVLQARSQISLEVGYT